MTAEERQAAREWDRRREPSNKRMKQTKLSPAPFRGRRCRLMPALARSDAGTASQLIRGVRWTQPEVCSPHPGRRVAGWGSRAAGSRSAYCQRN
jgi:hypothetical protein